MGRRSSLTTARVSVDRRRSPGGRPPLPGTSVWGAHYHSCRSGGRPAPAGLFVYNGHSVGGPAVLGWTLCYTCWTPSDTRWTRVGHSLGSTGILHSSVALNPPFTFYLRLGNYGGRKSLLALES